MSGDCALNRHIILESMQRVFLCSSAVSGFLLRRRTLSDSYKVHFSGSSFSVFSWFDAVRHACTISLVRGKIRFAVAVLPPNAYKVNLPADSRSQTVLLLSGSFAFASRRGFPDTHEVVSAPDSHEFGSPFPAIKCARWDSFIRPAAVVFVRRFVVVVIGLLSNAHESVLPAVSFERFFLRRDVIVVVFLRRPRPRDVISVFGNVISAADVLPVDVVVV